MSANSCCDNPALCRCFCKAIPIALTKTAAEGDLKGIAHLFSIHQGIYRSLAHQRVPSFSVLCLQCETSLQLLLRQRADRSSGRLSGCNFQLPCSELAW